MAMTCVVCGNKAGLTANALSNGNGLICQKCVKAAGGMKNWMNIRKMSPEEIKSMVGKSGFSATNMSEKKLEDVFIPSNSVGRYILVDEVNKKVKFPQVTMQNALNNLFTKDTETEYDFSEIVGCELIENDNSVTKGGLGAAAVGGALFGGAGAITGGIVGKKKTTGICKNLRVKVSLNNMNKPMLMIDFIQTPTKTTSQQYLKAQEDAHRVMSMIQLICNKNDKAEQLQGSSADEIMKFKGLLDAGAITREEFEAKKKQLLGL